jgi:hypothetical protein
LEGLFSGQETTAKSEKIIFALKHALSEKSGPIGVSEAALAMFSDPPSAQGPANLVGGCVGGGYAVNCAMLWGSPVNPFVRIVPPPADPAEQDEATTRARLQVGGVLQAVCRSRQSRRSALSLRSGGLRR